ncbi:hypothetical protein SteCoe_4588 [Stentor coeruleus]|uniref:Protein kinase domain-containing protein n=1 Tax=Stentor coeruleus TaxID=5963 RepID=A0A1R2CU78_9CILI|nr:hypothetical protein SteCoe_4588 [Stentor coeruleus]
MKIHIFYEEEFIEIELPSDSKISDLQEAIALKLSLAPSSQILTLRTATHKQDIIPSQTLLECNITQTSVIFLKKKLSNRPRIPHRRTQSELSPWVSRLVISCQDGNLDDFYEILKDYEKYKQASLEVEDLKSLLNTAYNNKWCCIHYAAYCNNGVMVKELLDLAADPNSVTEDHWTPLQISCYKGHIDCVKILLAHPALEINKMTSERGTGLHLASQNAHIDIVKLLLQSNIDVSLEDPSGQTALELAGNIEIVEEIPKHIGEQILKKYSISEIEKPLGFSGEVWYTAGSASTEKYVFLCLDIENGNFNHYKSRNDYVNELQPKYTIPFNTIIEVKVSNEIFDEKYFFLITAPDVKLKYYTAFKDMTEEWTNKILHSIKYYRQPGVKDINKKQPSPPEIPEPSVHLHCFEIIEEIGFGNYGKVFKVKKKGTEEVYALKCLNIGYLRQKKQIKYAIAECKIMKNIRHPFILPLLWAFQSETHLFMVLEYCCLGDFSMLLNYVHHLNVQQARIYIAEIILALEYLHSLDIVYRDLKPHNLLFDDSGHLKLSDFGLAKENVTEENKAMSFCGSPAYLAPEMIAQKGVWEAFDIYCIGINLYEFLTGEIPFYSEDINDLYANITYNKLKFPIGFDENAQDLINKATEKDPAKRPNIQSIKEHPFFAEIVWQDVLNKNISPPFNAQFLKGIKIAKSN